MLGGVFISYRREDSGGFAGRIYDRLSSRLGRDSVFFDVDNIPPGLDFVDVLSERVGKCDALVAVIGRAWNPVGNESGRPRLDDPNDFVRIEIEAALTRGVRVVPVLVDGAPMPRAEDLPDSLKKLTRRQGIEISHTRFDSDVVRLTDALSQLEEELREREAGNAAVKPRPQGAAAAGATVRNSALADPPKDAVVVERRPGSRRWPLFAAALGLIVAAALFATYFSSRRLDTIAGGDAPGSSPAKPQVEAPAVAPTPNSTLSDGWLTGEQFKSEMARQLAAGFYPDMMTGRCEDGLVSFHAHWAERPQGLRIVYQFGTFEERFNERKSSLIAQGFSIQYQNTFKDCDGRTRYQTLWTKSD